MFTSISRRKLLVVSLVVAIFLSNDVFAQAVLQENESRGPGGYGWQQVFNVSSPAAGTAMRLTGSGDRRYYDWQFKQIQLSARAENYWSRDSGWWYVNSTPSQVSFLLRDAKNQTVLNLTDQLTTRGRNTTTYTWNATDDDPGEWLAEVRAGGLVSIFRLFVRGMLNVTNVTTNSTPDPYVATAGQNVRIIATLKDNAGNVIRGNYTLNNGTSAPPNLTLYITGAGDEQNFSMSDSGGTEDAVANDGNWSRVVSLRNVGDHKIIVKASDEHTYWLDGRRSTWIYVNGTYSPDYNIDYASIVLKLADFVRWLRILFIFPLFGLVALRRTRPVFVLVVFALLIHSDAVGASSVERTSTPLHGIADFFSKISTQLYSYLEPGIITVAEDTPKANAEFKDGMVIVNTIKPVYSIGEKAELVAAALNGRGLPACDAEVELILIDPRGEREKLVLEKRMCGLYSASYVVKLAGSYRVEAKARGNLVEASFSTHFSASEKPRYSVRREADSVINPKEKGSYHVTIEVESDEEFLVREVLPGEFEVIATDGTVAVLEDKKIITWYGKGKGTFEYTYSAPENFALHEIATEVNGFTARWYLAVDPLTLFSAIIRPSALDSCTSGGAACGSATVAQIQNSDNNYLDGGRLNNPWSFNASMFNTTALPSDAVVRSARVNIEILWDGTPPTGCTLRVFENSTTTWRLVSSTCLGGTVESNVSYDVSSIIDSEQDAEGSKVSFGSTGERAWVNYVFLNVTYVRDAGPPLWRNLMTNATGNTITRGQSINLSAQGNDTTSLFRATLETNHTGVDTNWTDGSYGSPMLLGNVSNTWVWSNFTWRDDNFPWPRTSDTFRFRIWYEDEVPRLNATNYLTVTVNMSGDTRAPRWSAQNQQQVTGEEFHTMRLNAFWSDDVAMHTAILEINDSTTKSNVSITAFSQNNGNASSNFTWANTGGSLTPGTVVRWRIYANDTSNKWNVTNEMNFTIVSLEVPITGRWSFARGMQGIELEEVTQQSCFRAPIFSNTIGGCHLVDANFTALFGTQGDDGVQTVGRLDQLNNSLGGGFARHSGANRDPAGFYAPWVHRRMGGTNWPTWDTAPFADEGTTGDPCREDRNITRPCRATIATGDQGNSDAKIGEAGSADLSFNRTHYQWQRYAGQGVGQWGDVANIYSIGYPDLNLGGTKTWNSNRLAIIGGCAFGFQSSGDYIEQTEHIYSSYSGCHGIRTRDQTKVAYNRNDNISCAGQCHQGLIINSTNSKHGTVEGAKCDNCHLGIVSRNTTEHNNATLNANNTGGFYLSGVAEPRVRWCLECHQNTSNWNKSNTNPGKLGNRSFSDFLPPPFVHAGRDCRYCHGHGMNITRNMTWGRTCGGEDLICHSKSSPFPRNIGTLTHGSTSFNVTCGDCHLNPSEPTHNVTLPRCRKCHNSTGVGNASASGPVPNWDSKNRIYHGNESRGTKGGKFCAECHIPRDSSNLSKGYVNTTDPDQHVNIPHMINITQLGNKNFVPLCQAATCHGNATTLPQAPPGNENGTWIPEIHGKDAPGPNKTNAGSGLECVNCHNNRSIVSVVVTGGNESVLGLVELNTSIHASLPSRMVPFNIQRGDGGNLSPSDCVKCHNRSVYYVGRNISNNQPYNCALCHGQPDGKLIIHDADMEQIEFVSIDGRHEQGNPQCLRCHSVGLAAPKHVDNVTMDDTLYVHRNLNSRSGDPGMVEDLVGRWGSRNRKCWACHSNGSVPNTTETEGDINMGLNRTAPWQCPDCHLPTGSQNSRYASLSNYTVTEHFANGTDIRAGTNQPLIVLSCIGCHNKTEMLLSANDPDETDTMINANPGRGYARGGNSSFYHYGRNRTGDSLVRLTRNASTKNLYGYSNLTRLQYTNCLYCHQNTSTNFDTAMNNSVYHTSMLNHSSRNGSPFCTDCHGYGRLHDSNLSKPYRNYTAGEDRRGMWNSSLCVTCHDDRSVHGSDAASPNANVNLSCAGCHANASLYNNPTANDTKQIHGVRYLQLTGTYSAPWSNGTAIECRTCHISTNVTLVNSSYIEAYPPKILPDGAKFNHSTSAVAGGKWGSYWNDTDASLKNDSCYFCHGNVRGDVKHNASALGRVNVSYRSNATLNVSNVINGSINQSSKWCGSCHYPSNPYYNDMMARFGNESALRPPNNTDMAGKVASDGTSFFDHTGTLASKNASDEDCKTCHGGALSGGGTESTTATMDEFAHNVDVGRGGTPNCISCHNVGETGAPRHVNISAMNTSLSIHRNLNNRSGDPAERAVAAGGDPGKSWGVENRRCWACHSNGSVPNTTATKGDVDMGMNRTTPWQCPDCHLPTGSQNSRYASLSNYTVTEHFANGTDIRAGTNQPLIVLSCIGCHNKTEMLLLANDPDIASANFDRARGYTDAGNESFYHYGRNRTSESLVRQTRNASTKNLYGYSNLTRLQYTNCLYCHQNTSTNFTSAMNNSAYHSDMMNHSSRNGSPFCTDCHGYGRLHDSNLSKPYRNYTAGEDRRGMWNSSLCVTCHDDRSVHGSDAASPNANVNLSCAGCHANASLYNNPTANDTKQIHGVRYLQLTGAYSSPWSNGTAIECRTCHISTNVTLVNSSYIEAYPPKILPDGAKFNHSTSAVAGGKWGSYWNDTDASLKNDSCYFCHGNVRGDVKHNASALGRVNVSYRSNATLNVSNVINGSINQSSKWCGSCHYPNNPFYNNTRQRFISEGANPPPNNTDMVGQVASDGTSFFDHTSTLSQTYPNASDADCKRCHGGVLSNGGIDSTTATMDEFAHNVDVGRAGTPNCISCHNLGESVPKINVSAMNTSLSVHANLNNRAGDPALSANGGDPGKSWGVENRRCWACHSNGSVPNTTATKGLQDMGVNQTTPWQCPDCHLPTGSQNSRYASLSNYTVTEHFANGTDIRAGTNQPLIVLSCIGCHNKTEMLIVANDPNIASASFDRAIGYTDAGNSSFYHYGRNRTGDSLVRQTRNASTKNLYGYSNLTRLQYTNCLYCHQNTSTNFDTAMNNSVYHTSMLNHSSRNGSPFCTDCHGYGRLHDSNITKPYKNSTVSWGGMWNSSLCVTCHDDRSVHGSDAASPNANVNLTCAGCHANASLYNDPAANDTKQIHGVRYLQLTGAYSAPWSNGSAVECRSCHTNSNITIVNSSYIEAYPPQVIPSGTQFNHSNSEKAGAKWNNNSAPFWNDTDASPKNDSCYYCHGNVRGDVKHNATALGRVTVALGNNTINGSINGTSKWCGGCHYPSNSNYNNMRQRFISEGATPPPNNTDLKYNASDGTEFFNHTNILTNNNDSDEKCRGCHGGLLSQPAELAGMDQFAHRVKTGEYGNVSCTRCHDPGGQVPRGRQINLTAMNQSKHSNISTRRPFGAGNKRNESEPCWACHLGIEGEPTQGTGVNTHPTGYDRPRNCYFCHQYTDYNATLDRSNNYSAPIVRSHTPNGTRSTGAIVRAANCWDCHANSTAVFGQPAKDSVLFNASHYQIRPHLTQPERLPNTSSNVTGAGCEACHDPAGISRTYYSFAPTITSGMNREPGVTDCWKCHVAIKRLFDPLRDDPNTIAGYRPERSFHDDRTDSNVSVFRYVESCYQTGCHSYG